MLLLNLIVDMPAQNIFLIDKDPLLLSLIQHQPLILYQIVLTNHSTQRAFKIFNCQWIINDILQIFLMGS